MKTSSNAILRRNTISSLSYQIVAIVCGFIIPRLILKQYGSNVNGLVNSISQFLSIVSFLELGIGSVVKSSLYKPCTEKDYQKISAIYKSAQKFFNTIALVLVAYVIVLLIIFPRFISNNFSWWFIDSLIVTMSVTSFAEYYFGAVNALLLQADERNSIFFNIRIITLLANTAVCYLLIKLNCSIQIVKLATSAIFVVRPVFLSWYVRNNYKIDKKIEYKDEPIKQKWNGIAQHVASVVLTQTDTIILTIFATLEDVSIYSVYYMPVVAIEQLVIYGINGYESHVGKLWATANKEAIASSYKRFVWILHLLTVILYGCAASSIGSFVRIYTNGITDANYEQPLFGFVLIGAYVLYCLRLPSTTIIKAAGHYRQTQNTFIIATIINLVVSILAVNRFGLIGVAVGTAISMFYHLVRLSVYTSRYLIERPIKDIVRQIVNDLLIILMSFPLSYYLLPTATNYVNWALIAFLSLVIWIGFGAIVSAFMYKSYLVEMIKKYSFRR